MHPLLRNHTILWTFYQYYVKSMLWVGLGTSGGLDQVVGTPTPEKNHVSRSQFRPFLVPTLLLHELTNPIPKVFLNKSARVSPYISQPYRDPSSPDFIPRSFFDNIRSKYIIQKPVAYPAKGIDLAPWPKLVTADGGVKFTDNGRLEYRRLQRLEKTENGGRLF